MEILKNGGIEMNYNNITPISPKAYEVFKYLADLARMDEGHAAKIDNAPGFMPVFVEIIFPISEGEEQISIAHYGEENGDLMRDPEMIFFHDRKEGKAYPMEYRNDYGGTLEVSIKDDLNGRPKMVNRERQKQHASFADLWMKNIKAQQRIKL